MKIPACFVATFGLALVACGGSSSDISGTGIFKLAITDAPVDNADAVVVSVSEVHLLGNDDNDAESFVFDAPQMIDLLALQGGLSEVLVDGASVGAGAYSGVRLVVDTPPPSCNNLTAPFASYITIDGTDYPLVVPSGAQSGLKINSAVVVEPDSQAAYTIDFDLRKSVAQRGATGCYNLRPTLRLVSDSDVGVLQGEVSGALLSREQCTADVQSGAGAAVYIYSDAGATADDVGSQNEPLASGTLTALDDGSGDFSYSIGFLSAGNYTAAFSCQAGDDDPETDDEIVFEGAQDVQINAGSDTELDFTLQSLTER